MQDGLSFNLKKTDEAQKDAVPQELNTLKEMLEESDKKLAEETEVEVAPDVSKQLTKEMSDEIARLVKSALQNNMQSSIGDNQKDALMIEILKQISETQNENLKSQKEILSLNKKRVFGIRSIDQSEIDPSDVLDKPCIFFAWGFSTVVADDYVNGLTIQPPYSRAINFRHLYRLQNPNGKFASYSYCMIYSAKQAEFLRRHSDFNVRIFESLNDATSVENDYMTHVIAANDKLKKMGAHELISFARNKNVPVTSMDTGLLKTQLMKIMVEESMKDIKTRNTTTLEQRMYENTSNVM